jgi:glyoxylase-like metal-dependent hydrolase (beta-lactamase superfamily II)
VSRLKIGLIGENCYIVVSEGAVLIVDPGAEAEKIYSFLQTHALAPTMIVLTHGHLDHTAAIPELFGLLKAELPIAMHPADAHYLGETSETTNRELFEAIGAPSYFRSFWQPLPKAAVFLSEGMMVPGTSLQVIHTPGHSRGSICLYEAALDAGSYGMDEEAREDDTEESSDRSCLISGDTLFRDGVGRTDAPDSDPIALERSLKKLAHLSFATLVFPGHGPRTTIGRELPAALRD